ncbi:MAG: hypothetical protein ACLQHS_00860 [Candidatus Limnocylindrales bacterium]
MVDDRAALALGVLLLDGLQHPAYERHEAQASGGRRFGLVVLVGGEGPGDAAERLCLEPRLRPVGPRRRVLGSAARVGE